MLNLTAEFNGLLQSHGAPAAAGTYDLGRIDEFLKEAYRIVCTPLSFCPLGACRALL